MKTLRLLANHEMASLEPNGAFSDSSSATLVLKNVCPGLVRLGADLGIEPALAQRWTTEDGFRRWRFRLQPGARFHSGRAVDAEAIAWNIARLFDGRVGSVLAQDYQGFAGAAALARDEVELRFEMPFASLLHHLAWRTHIADDRLDQPIGAGAYRLVEWARGSHLLFERHDAYWESGRPHCDRVKVVFAAQADRRRALIEAGEVDIVESVPVAMAAELGARGLIETASLASGRKSVVVFNCARPPFDDPRVREAAALAVDRDALRREFFGDKARSLDGVYAPDDPWGTAVAPIAYDPRRARALLREAGIDTVRVDGVASAVHPTARVAARIVEMLRPAGFEVDLKTYDDPPWWPFIYLRSPWQIAFHNMSARPHPDILFGRDFRSGAAFNAGFYASPALDLMWGDARREPDAARQRALYDAAQRQVRADLPFLPLWATDSLVGWRPGVSGMRAHPMGFVDLAAIDLEAA